MKIITREEVMFSNRIAIADDKGNKITYKELAEKAKEILNNVQERSLVFCLCDHQFETAELIYMILYLNRVPLLLPSDIEQGFLDSLIEIYQPQYIYCNTTHEISKRYSQELVFKNHILVKTNKKVFPMHPDLALLLSTSGTTGSAKLVKLTYENLLDNAQQVCSYMGIEKEQKGISPLPMNYAYGFSFCLQHWYCGATLLITEEPVMSRAFREFYEKEKVNNFAATPYTYQILQRVEFWNQEKLEYLHCAMSAGAQLHEKEQRELVSAMKDKFWNMYGQTECFGVVLGMNFKENNIIFGSVGRAFGTIEAFTDNQTKELLIKCGSVFMGYACHIADLADGDKNKGILHTGDIAEIDEEGCIYLKGRLARYIKILGKRISLDDIEKYLADKFSEAEVACTGTDDKLFVFYSGTEDNLEEAIQVLLDVNMRIPKKFISCIGLKELPRNTSGKVLYAKLKELSKL